MAAKAPGFQSCVGAVEKAAGRELTEDEVIQVFSRVQGTMRRYRAQGLSATDAALRAGQEIGDRMRLAGVIEKRNKLLNVARRREIEGRLTEGREAQDLRRIINETDRLGHGLTAEVFGPFVAALERAGLVKALSRGDQAFDRDVARELWSIESGGKAVTKNAQARAAAEIINRAQETTRTMQNDAGAWIGKLDHYVTRQSHDMDKVRAAGFEKWRDDILPRLDERTFDSLDEVTPESVNDFLRRTYNAIASGVHDTARGRVAWGDVGASTGPANLAKRVSQERKLLFKDADAWTDYNQQYGRGTLMDAVRGGLENGAKNTALMRTWGPNPEAMLKTITDAETVKARDRGDFKGVDALNTKTNENYFSLLTGASSIDANMPVLGGAGGLTYGQLTAGTTALQTLSKLGGVVLSSIPDFAVNTAVLRHNGVGLFESMFNQIASLLPKSAARREVSTLSAAGIDSILGNIAARFTGQDAVRGTSAKLVDLFFKLNLQTWWTESLKGGMAAMLTHNMGRLAGTAFDALDPRLRATMQRYNITQADWDVARAGAAKAADGRVYVLPAHIADPAVRSKFFNYVTDQVRDGMTEPTLFSRNAQTWGGLQAGTPAGAAARIIMQFKTYPITFMNRVYEREMRGSMSPKQWDVPGIAKMIALTTALGYAALELKQLARGREPRTANADDTGDYLKILSAAIVQGGGLGLYGDFLFGDTSRMGAGPVLSLFGPTAGSLDDVAKTAIAFRKYMEGDVRAGGDAASGALGVVRDNTPFINLFYLRTAMDYLIWYRLQEAMNPGYLARYEDRMRRENDVEFMLSPTASPYR